MSALPCVPRGLSRKHPAPSLLIFALLVTWYMTAGAATHYPG
jgi:hypothetical protein